MILYLVDGGLVWTSWSCEYMFCFSMQICLASIPRKKCQNYRNNQHWGGKPTDQSKLSSYEKGRITVFKYSIKSARRLLSEGNVFAVLAAGFGRAKSMSATLIWRVFEQLKADLVIGQLIFIAKHKLDYLDWLYIYYKIFILDCGRTKLHFICI